MNLLTCERLAIVSNKIAKKDESEVLYDILFLSNEKRVIFELDLHNKLVLNDKKIWCCG